jgi:ABC-type cobalamin transport system ATPase subunit
MVAAQVDPERLVFVDEMGVHTSLAPLYGYSPKGERVHLQAPRNRGRNTTLLASITLGGMGETRWPLRAPRTRKSSRLM